VAGVDVAECLDRLEDVRELRLHAIHLLVAEVEARQVGDVEDVLAADLGHGPMVARDRRRRIWQHGRVPVQTIPIGGGRIEAYPLSGGTTGTPVVVLGGVETGFRRLAGTEQVLERRWAQRSARRPVIVIGRPLPDDPADAERIMHPRVIADAIATALRTLDAPSVAIEAESGGGRIGLWLTVDHPELVERLVLAAVASETPPGSPMAERMGRWIELGEAGDWGTFFADMAQLMKAATEEESGSFGAAARLQPRPATPERFIGELKATLDPSSFVTGRLGEIAVPALVLAGELDRVVPLASTRLVAERIPGATLITDPESGHTVRSSFRGYDDLVEAFLAEPA
jgi:pimeloyl-ACP methyl ester carboxylesterase